MGKQKKHYIDETTTFEVESGFYIIKNEVATEWLKIIRPNGIALYNLYSSIANQKTKSWFISVRTLEEYLDINRSTISDYNWLLEHAGLIRITVGTDGDANTYTILQPDPVSDDHLNALRAVLALDASDGKRFAGFKKQILKHVDHWKKLSDCGKQARDRDRRAKLDALFTTRPDPPPNGSGHQTELPIDPDPLPDGISNQDIEAWDKTLNILRGQMPKSTFHATLKDSTPIRRDDQVLVIAVKNKAALDWVENRLLDTIQRAAQEYDLTSLGFEVEVISPG